MGGINTVIIFTFIFNENIAQKNDGLCFFYVFPLRGKLMQYIDYVASDLSTVLLNIQRNFIFCYIFLEINLLAPLVTLLLCVTLSHIFI